MRELFFVDAFAGQGVVHVCHGYDPRRQGNLLAPQPARIAAAVRSVRDAIKRYRGPFPKSARRGIGRARPEAFPRRSWCALASPGTRARQSALLEQDAIGNADLADVVQRAGQIDQADELGVDRAVELSGLPASFWASSRE